jgi:peptidoglycan/LPS O-acetylase OafA/YrhL
VVPDVAGSSPVVHPIDRMSRAACFGVPRPVDPAATSSVGILPSVRTGNVLQRAWSSAASPLGRRELDLDVVRGVAILLAVGWHLAGPATGDPVTDALLFPARAFGWAGVDLFFVLSGFLVGRIIFREAARTGRFDGRRFLIRRIFKLWPVYYAFLLFLVLTSDPWWRWNLIADALNVQNYALTQPPHLWSLAVEEHFYLAFALLFPLALRASWRPVTLVRVLAGVLVATLAARIVAQLADMPPVQIQLMTHFRIDALCAGVLLAAVAVYYPERFDRVVQAKPLWLGVAAAAVVWLCLVSKVSPLGTTAGFTVSYLGSAAFLLLLHRARWVVAARAVLRPVGGLGIYSYAIYLTHVSTAVWLGKLLDAVTPGLHQHATVRLGIMYLAVFVVAIVATRLIEWPSLKLRDRVLPRTPAPRASVPVAAPREAPIPVPALQG